MKRMLIGITMVLFFMAIMTFGAMKISPIIDKWIPYIYERDARVSWYGEKFHGNKMANGKIYDMYNPLITAHKTLPFGTIIQVIYNEKCLFTRINDRGPYKPGKEFDLSYGGAKKLGIVKKGVASVKIRVFVFTSEKFYFYKIKKGETLKKLFDNNWSKIAEINNLDPKNIKKGTKIIVPYKL